MNYFDLLYAHDVAEKVGNPGVIGAIAAGLAMFALLSGVAKIKRKSVAKEFPADPEALQAKYLLAFRQLQDATKDSPEGVDGLLKALKSNPAAYMALEAFGQYQSKYQSTSQSQHKTRPSDTPKSHLPPKGDKA
ncbi:MAG: hypothetical protein WCT03_21135 [Candidatus Obscuribacterales bacterium]|jgi:hypothetical protein